MSAPTKPKVLHVYRSDGPNPLWIDQHCTAPYPDPTHRLCRGEYLGEYVPAPGPVVAERWEVRWLDSAGARCSITCPDCKGNGYDWDDTVCELCDARGTIVDADTVTDNITIPRDLYELLKEAAEKWAEGCIYKTFNPETVADFACTHCDRKGDPIEHTADCKAARILGLKREGEG